MPEHVVELGEAEIAAWLAGRRRVTSRVSIDEQLQADALAADHKRNLEALESAKGTSIPSPGPAPTTEPTPPPPAPVEKDVEYNPLGFSDAAQFMLFFCDEFELYKWQVEELMRLSGYVAPGLSNERVTPTPESPILYNLVATNGSGKDATILAGLILWKLSCSVRATVIGTSFTEQQVEGQTFKHCRFYAERINRKLGDPDFFKIKYLHITCTKTDSECRLFVTNEAGRAEGYHANPGRDFLFIANEAKSIEEPLWGGFARYSGWNYWIEISSAGEDFGHFYRNCTDKEAVHYPNPLVLGLNYVRYIRLEDCPHLLAGNVRIKSIIRHFGIDSPEYKSVVNSEFASQETVDILIKRSLTKYETPEWYIGSLRPVCGVDLSLGGDETVVSIWHGNKRTKQIAFRERDETSLHLRLIDIFVENNLVGDQIAMDAGGLGLPVVKRIVKAGYNVTAFNFGGSARDKDFFLNLGAEIWQFLKMMVLNKRLILPHEDEKFMEQLTRRRFRYQNGKMKLEEKKEAKARGEDSPDRVDAAVMAWSLVDINAFLDQIEEAEEAAKPRVPQVLNMEQIHDLVNDLKYTKGHSLSGEFVPNQTSRFKGTICKILGLGQMKQRVLRRN